AVRIVELGADLERVCKLLRWKEFEDISALAFENSGYSVLKHFRFRHLDKRWEVDILALNNPFVISVDCKHWRRGWQTSAVQRTAKTQAKRTQNLAEASASLRDRMGISRWRSATFIPMILSLIPGPFKFYEGVAIVPIFQLRDFINQMPVHTSMLIRFSKKF
ncbi:MAG: NERD domain-containing protein, partial [Candidatus Bathyarchaeia archaeon]